MTAWPSVYVTNTIQNSPIAAASETVIGTLQVTTDAASVVEIMGFCTATIGTSGVSLRLRIRADSVTGTVVGDSQAIAATAAAISVGMVTGSPVAIEVAARTFVLTATIASGAANTTIQNMMLLALCQF